MTSSSRLDEEFILLLQMAYCTVKIVKVLWYRYLEVEKPPAVMTVNSTAGQSSVTSVAAAKRPSHLAVTPTAMRTLSTVPELRPVSPRGASQPLVSSTLLPYPSMTLARLQGQLEPEPPAVMMVYSTAGQSSVTLVAATERPSHLAVTPTAMRTLSTVPELRPVSPRGASQPLVSSTLLPYPSTTLARLQGQLEPDLWYLEVEQPPAVMMVYSTAGQSSVTLVAATERPSHLAVTPTAMRTLSTVPELRPVSPRGASQPLVSSTLLPYPSTTLARLQGQLEPDLWYLEVEQPPAVMMVYSTAGQSSVTLVAATERPSHLAVTPTAMRTLSTVPELRPVSPRGASQPLVSSTLLPYPSTTLARLQGQLEPDLWYLEVEKPPAVMMVYSTAGQSSVTLVAATERPSHLAVTPTAMRTLSTVPELRPVSPRGASQPLVSSTLLPYPSTTLARLQGQLEPDLWYLEVEKPPAVMMVYSTAGQSSVTLVAATERPSHLAVTPTAMRTLSTVPELRPVSPRGASQPLVSSTLLPYPSTTLARLQGQLEPDLWYLEVEKPPAVMMVYSTAGQSSVTLVAATERPSHLAVTPTAMRTLSTVPELRPVSPRGASQPLVSSTLLPYPSTTLARLQGQLEPDLWYLEVEKPPAVMMVYSTAGQSSVTLVAATERPSHLAVTPTAMRTLSTVPELRPVSPRGASQPLVSSTLLPYPSTTLARLQGQLEPETMMWEELQMEAKREDLPGARAGHSAVAINSRNYIWSGRDGYKKAWNNQVCCKDLWHLEFEKPPAVGGIQLFASEINFLEVNWPALPQVEHYILQVQKQSHYDMNIKIQDAPLLRQSSMPVSVPVQAPQARINKRLPKQISRSQSGPAALPHVPMSLSSRTPPQNYSPQITSLHDKNSVEPKRRYRQSNKPSTLKRLQKGRNIGSPTYRVPSLPSTVSGIVPFTPHPGGDLLRETQPMRFSSPQSQPRAKRPSKSKVKKCIQCGKVIKDRMKRHIDESPACNACYVYLNNHKMPRPENLW
ncbi:mucin-2-like isoform X2 [Macrosteles quadrilineatus]|uniref:mucin-2-like isoform X2 n=1 Tax=Macrosteles quadrilineatus TaxID=74068 RepID=UPI0023E0A949|nr:mucin-2-like isoform X2 [Macrosteles quadrilineatus]